MTPERRLNPITAWNTDLDDDGKVLRYWVASEVEEYGVTYEIRRTSNNKWASKIAADGHVTYCPLRHFDTAEDALAAMLKRCQMI